MIVDTVALSETTASSEPESQWSVDVRGLSLRYAGARTHRALDGIDLQIRPGQILAVIGETGSGKSTLIRSILGLSTVGATTSGSIRVNDGAGRVVEPLTLSPRQASAFRRGSIGYVPQLTQRALVPMLTVSEHFGQFGVRMTALATAGTPKLSRAEIDLAAIAALEEIGLKDGERVLRMYPHQLSGGMAQRVCIALAMFGSAQLIVADEPTSGLDAVVRRRVAELLELEITGTARTMILVTHDLALAKRLSTDVAVLLRGALVESGRSEDFFSAPQHPYSRHLLASIPRPGEPLPLPYSGIETA